MLISWDTNQVHFCTKLMEKERAFPNLLLQRFEAGQREGGKSHYFGGKEGDILQISSCLSFPKCCLLALRSPGHHSDLICLILGCMPASLQGLLCAINSIGFKKQKTSAVLPFLITWGGLLMARKSASDSCSSSIKS